MIEIKVDAKRQFKDKISGFDSPNVAMKEAAQVIYALRDVLEEYLGYEMANYAFTVLGTRMVTGRATNRERSHHAR